MAEKPRPIGMLRAIEIEGTAMTIDDHDGRVCLLARNWHCQMRIVSVHELNSTVDLAEHKSDQAAKACAFENANHYVLQSTNSGKRLNDFGADRGRNENVESET